MKSNKSLDLVKKSLTTTFLIFALSIVFLGTNVQASSSSVNDNFDSEFHVIGTLSDEGNSINPNIKIENEDNCISAPSNSIQRKPGNGTYLFTIYNSLWTRKTNVYENGYSTPKNFIQYVSSVWAKRSQYTETSTYTVSWTRSASITLDIAEGVKAQYGLSKSVSGSLGIGSVIPADSTRYSKLALYAKFHDYYLKCIESDIESTTIYNTYYGDVLLPTGDLYFDVVYQ